VRRRKKLCGPIAAIDQTGWSDRADPPDQTRRPASQRM
jgi:hypothetical protein